MLEKSKRKHKRFPLFAIAELKCGNKSITTMVDNISLQGIGLYSLKPLELGARVEIQIKFISTEGDEKSDTLTGTVVWSLRRDDIYMMGIVFDSELTSEEHPNLYNHWLYLKKWE
jgi:hypothetical protein